MKNNKQVLIGIGILALIIVVMLVAFLGNDEVIETQDPAALQAGIDYIKGLEALDPVEVENELKEQRRQERIALLESGELSVWEQMEDAVVMGDSRGVGFYYYNYLPEERVLAEGGATIADIPEQLDTLKSLNPAQIFLCYGLNDVSIGYWDNPEEYLVSLEEVLQQIWDTLPDVEIYISSILIARDPAFETASVWRNIPDFNVAIKAYCEEKGYHFVDNSDLCDKYADLWDSDGIHLNKEFYPYWATNLVAATYTGE